MRGVCARSQPHAHSPAVVAEQRCPALDIIVHHILHHNAQLNQLLLGGEERARERWVMEQSKAVRDVCERARRRVSELSLT